MTANMDDSTALFWDAAQPLLASGTAIEGTMMGTRCLRVGKEFLAMPHHKEAGLVVKLSKERVVELIDDGEGQQFAPAGKVFKEWVHVPSLDEDRWTELLNEGAGFVA